jgi:Ca-activated chloride channel homolog
MFQFEWIWMFLLVPLPLIIWRFMPADLTKSAINVPAFSGFETSKADAFFQIPSRRNLFLFLIWLLMISGSARPQWVGDLASVPSSGRDLMLAIDVSGSMKARDLETGQTVTTRLDVVKQLGIDFLRRRVGDRLGLILFGTNAYLQAPLSHDRDTVSTLLSEAVIGIAGEKTAIGDAIGLAIKRLQDENVEHKVLILMTDGANTAGRVSPRSAMEMATKQGLRIYTIGIGADSMMVRGLLGARRINPSAELDERLLTDIADTTGGRYFRAKSQSELDEIYQIIDRIEPVPGTDQSARNVQEYFYVPAGLAVFLLMLWLFSIERGSISARGIPNQNRGMGS